ncbi:hypothetical protein BDW75DRAFT_202888 [Aspergillus navahoensis]
MLCGDGRGACHVWVPSLRPRPPCSRCPVYYRPLTTTFTRQADTDLKTTVLQLMQKMQQDFARSFPYVSPEIHHALSLESTPLFNTIVNIQRARVSVPSSDTELVWQAETGHDPSEATIHI